MISSLGPELIVRTEKPLRSCSMSPDDRRSGVELIGASAALLWTPRWPIRRERHRAPWPGAIDAGPHGSATSLRKIGGHAHRLVLDGFLAGVQVAAYDEVSPSAHDGRAGISRCGTGDAMTLLWAMIIIAGLIVLLLGSSVRVINQYQRGVVLRFGQLREAPRGPGLTLIAPIADRLHKVNMQVVTMPVPAQDGITRDNVTVKVDAVVYYRVTDPVKVVVDVQKYDAAIAQVAQASLRSIIGKSDLDDLLSNRERLNEGLEIIIDSPALSWGVQIDRVEIKDVALPETMKRSMSRQAEAERERRSRIITADGELQASRTLAEAAQIMAEHPAALQLRLLQTVVEVAAEKNSTLVLPFPVELLRFLERATPPLGAAADGS
jgi:regulator of protease activity HflC (stomatin/prohibitin superfamily)